MNRERRDTHDEDNEEKEEEESLETRDRPRSTWRWKLTTEIEKRKCTRA